MKDKKRITKGIFINRISGGKEDGYLSIEAGLLLPFLMMVTTLLFYMEIYAYDRALLTNDCNLLCAKILENASLDKEEINDKLAELSALIKKEHPYLSASGFSMNVEHKATASTISLSLDFNTPIQSILDSNISFQRSIPTINPVEMMYYTKSLIKKDYKNENIN